MPRQPDPDLHERILNAAQKLWKKGAEKTLTMRAVAQAAGTNTPAVYRRFRNRDDILRALLRRIQQDVGDALRPAGSGALLLFARLHSRSQRRGTAIALATNERSARVGIATPRTGSPTASHPGTSANATSRCSCPGRGTRHGLRAASAWLQMPGVR